MCIRYAYRIIAPPPIYVYVIVYIYICAYILPYIYTAVHLSLLHQVCGRLRRHFWRRRVHFWMLLGCLGEARRHRVLVRGIRICPVTKLLLVVPVSPLPKMMCVCVCVCVCVCLSVSLCVCVYIYIHSCNKDLLSNEIAPRRKFC